MTDGTRARLSSGAAPHARRGERRQACCIRSDTSAACALAIALALLPASGRAHGGLWRANQILIAPDDPRRIVLQSRLRGPLISTDGGHSWSWACAETYGQSSISAAPVAMLIQPRGRMLIATYARGVVISDDGFCTTRAATGYAVRWARDLTSSSDGVIALASIEADGAVRDVLLHSRDEGTHFDVLGASLPSDFIASSVQASREAAARVYVAGLQGTGWTVARTDDAGATWRFGNVMPFAARTGMRPALLAVDAADPETLFVLRDEAEQSAASSSDALFVSRDGGATFSELFADGRPLHGFAASPDGATLLIAAESGLHAALRTEALARGRPAFTARASTPFYGLTWTAAGLYAGMEEFTNASAEAYSLGHSIDGGASFVRCMALCDVQPARCGHGSDAAALCSEVFSDEGRTGGGFKEDFLGPDRCGP